jgi:hypothetical protein
MFFIVKFNQKLFAAAKSTAMAVQRGDEVGAMREAVGMARAVQPLVQEAARKASNALIDGNDEVYASMARHAQMVVEAGRLIASANQGNGTFDRAVYLRGAALLDSALSGGG